MKKILYIMACIALATACVQEDKVGAPVDMIVDYVLPQGNASQKANDRIQAIYDTYGSYILYEYTQKDLEWSTASGTANTSLPLVDKIDPAYAEDMLDILDKVWLRFIPEELLKGKWLPYRIFMADTLKLARAEGSHSPMQRNPYYYGCQITGLSIAFAEVNQSLRNMDAAAAMLRKQKVQAIVWGYYFDKGIVDVSDIPDEFSEGTDYTPNLGYSPTDATLTARAFLRTVSVSSSRMTFNLTDPVIFPLSLSAWSTNSAATTTKANDVKAYVTQIVTTPTAELQPLFDANPLIKTKHDIVVTFIKTKYGIDLQAMGNATL
jgi:hypothetical protein